MTVLDKLPMRCTAWTLPEHLAVRRARQLVSEHSAQFGTTAEQVNCAQLAVSELATNALIHGTPPYELRLLRAGTAPIAWEIADADPDPDGIRGYMVAGTRTGQLPTDIGQLAEHGYGLLLVRAVTGGRVGVRTTTLCGTGQPAKGVWFCPPISRQKIEPPCL